MRCLANSALFATDRAGLFASLGLGHNARRLMAGNAEIVIERDSMALKNFV